MLEALPPGRPPRLVGPYRLLARIGAGGMGEVHLACRADAPTADPYRMVAVKTVREDLEVDGDFRTRFRREIAAARTVDGPGVARLVDAGADAPSPWLATEYVPGPSLAEAVVRTGPLPVAAVRALGAALARALAAVHGARVLHRDLKPANVLLGAAGPKLIDFGIAQAFEATALTSTGLVVGSPGFMAPEHLVGSRAVVPASDVFCLGAVLAFAVSGRGPFHDDELAAVVYRISRAEAELDGVPGELLPVLERCLRLDPAERPTAAELAALLGEDGGDGGGAVPGAFPWPGGVLSLVAEYGEAARTVGEAAASGAGVADLPTLGPVVPYSPTAVTDRPVAPAAVPAGRRRWGALAAGAVAVAVLATAGVVLADGGSGEPGGNGAAAPGASTAPAPAALDRVVLPYGGAGHANDFGAVGTDRAHRPAGWSPWTAGVEPGVGACALSPKALVCPGGGGAVTALGAADGKELWKVPGRGEGLRGGPQYPAVVGDTAYVTGPDGIVAYGLADGRERSRVPAPGRDWAVKGTDLRDGVLYSTYVNVRDERTGLVTAVRLRDGKELWRSPLDGLPEEPVAAAGRVLVPVGTTPVSLDARTGRETARGTEYCGGFTVHEKSGRVLCRVRRDGSVAVLDSALLRPLRTLGTGVTAGPAVRADGLVAVIGEDDGSGSATGRGALVVYDLESGRERWRVPDTTADRVYFAGDRVVVADATEIRSYPASGPGGTGEHEVYRFGLPRDFDAQVAGELLTAGGAAFAPLPGGLVVSGYLP
ncbi:MULTISPECIES: protein kinase domain-containing protein [unclassified Streptomyces]|uniref:serine/threonine-protein kinase n=1 Tax=unclassified Streptomyces TaxID=2593676 RepID=UPI0006AE1D63|nr:MULTISPECIES: serine/threonine-protein kinase [unclassified Streptomyces]